MSVDFITQPVLPQQIAVINGENKELVTWYQENIEYVKRCLNTKGALLFRSFDITSLSQFNRFANVFSDHLLDYTFRSTPRTRLGGKIYSSTEYPADRHIPLHNENSYTNNWPQHIMFFCAIKPSISGGETPIADSRQVYQKLSKEVVNKFEQLGVKYVRNYIPGIDLSWNEVFQTSDRNQVQQYCKQNNIQYSWGNDFVELTTSQVCKACLEHPTTKEKVWFNQAHLFHKSAIPEELQNLLLEEFGEGYLPRNAYYGDGSEIEQEVLDEIRLVYETCKLEFTWQNSDLLILDNLLMAHGRNPYEGERKIVVAMA